MPSAPRASRDLPRTHAGDWKLHDHAIEERDDDFLICLRVIRTTLEKRGQQNHRCWIWSLIAWTPDVFHPDGLGREDEIDASRVIALHHAVKGHLHVPQQTEHEAPTGEHHALGVDADFMLLSLADDGVVRVAVGGVPVREFVADPVDHGRTILLGLLHKAVNSGLGDSGVIAPVKVGMPDEDAELGVQIASQSVDCRKRFVSSDLENGICGGTQPTLSAALAARSVMRRSP
jgi:hypothetical protein